MKNFLLILILLCPASAFAKSWCAVPIRAHEWGVHVISEKPTPTPKVALPTFFHHSPPQNLPGIVPVRSLPVDSGERDLPVVQFYAPKLYGEVPIAVEVGFTEGEASAWFPQVDVRHAASLANSPEALAARGALLKARSQRDPMKSGSPLPEDPTRQLIWNHMTLTGDAPLNTPGVTPISWVAQLRAIDALWVNDDSESDRFLFYEGATAETPLLSLERGDTWAADRRHYILRNASAYPVHDVFIVHREGDEVMHFFAPQIPAGATAGFLLEAPVSVKKFSRDAKKKLRAALVDSATPTPPTEYDWSDGDCVMMRDPAIPVEVASNHRLFSAEVDAMIGVWGATFFEQVGTTIVYREDTRYLDHVMPLSIYTDMRHFIELRRAGLVVWEGVTLP